MMHKLTLDPSTQFGWCLLIDDSDRPEANRVPAGQRLFYGTWDLGRNKRRGQYYLNLRQQISDLRRRHGISEDDMQIVLEAEAYGAKRSEASRMLAAGWLVTVETYCERHQMTYPRTVTTTSWRAAFIRATQAPDEITDTQLRREWLKAAVLAECKARNLKPQNDNEADALGMMFWVVKGGLERQDKATAAKKAKASSKRAQKKLELQVAA